MAFPYYPHIMDSTAEVKQGCEELTKLTLVSYLASNPAVIGGFAGGEDSLSEASRVFQQQFKTLQSDVANLLTRSQKTITGVAIAFGHQMLPKLKQKESLQVATQRRERERNEFLTILAAMDMKTFGSDRWSTLEGWALWVELFFLNHLLSQRLPVAFNCRNAKLKDVVLNRGEGAIVWPDLFRAKNPFVMSQLFDLNFLRRERVYTKLKYSRSPQYDIVSGGVAALLSAFVGTLISEKFGYEVVDSGDFYFAFMYVVFAAFGCRLGFRTANSSSLVEVFQVVSASKSVLRYGRRIRWTPSTWKRLYQFSRSWLIYCGNWGVGFYRWAKSKIR